MLKNMRNIIQQFADRLTYRHWLIIAGTVSCVLGILVYLSLGNTTPEKVTVQPEQKKMVKVVTAKVNIPPRATIQEKMLTTVELPEEAVPEGALTDINQANNKPAAIIIMKGDIITQQKIMSDPKMAGFVGMIPPNCRAISVGISDVTGVAGFAAAGDYVDVMIVSGRKEEGRLIGQIVLQNVLLLGINKTGGGANEKPSNASGSKNEDGTVRATKESMATATLALLPDDALRLATAAQSGIIYLSLRPYAPSEKTVVTRDYILRTPQSSTQRSITNVESQRPSGARPAPSGGGSVEVIRGTTTTREGGR